MCIENTEKLYKATRDGCDESFRIRIHRAISWVKKARALPEEDIDLKFITLNSFCQLMVCTEGEEHEQNFAWAAARFRL